MMSQDEGLKTPEECVKSHGGDGTKSMKDEMQMTEPKPFESE